jgi:putative FmdB family regulatory protein
VRVSNASGRGRRDEDLGMDLGEDLGMVPLRRGAAGRPPARYRRSVPTYDYRCRTCDTQFEVRRSLTDETTAVVCPEGHHETSRVFSAVAIGGRSAVPAGAAPAASSGGCCGGGCCA